MNLESVYNQHRNASVDFNVLFYHNKLDLPSQNVHSKYVFTNSYYKQRISHIFTYLSLKKIISGIGFLLLS